LTHDNNDTGTITYDTITFTEADKSKQAESKQSN